MENPADFVPTIIPQQRKISTPRLTPIERILSPVQNKEQRPASANKRPSSALPQTPPPTVIPLKSASIPPESPVPPPIDTTPVKKTMRRSGTFDTEPEKISPPPPPPPPTTTTEPVSTFIEQPSDLVVSKPQTPPMDPDPTYPEYQSTLLTNSPPPQVPIPHKVSIEGKHPIKAIYSFLNEARRWAEQTQEITYSKLMFATEEISQQIPTRKPAGTLRKIPDIDSQTLIKAAKAQLPGEVCSSM